MTAWTTSTEDAEGTISAPVVEAEETDWPKIAPVEDAPSPVALPTAPMPEALAPLRERLLRAQERLAALEKAAPAQELPTRRAEDAGPSLLYALPTFLRDAEDLSDTPETLTALLPVETAAPRRRLHLA